jgi:hypothetical protein
MTNHLVFVEHRFSDPFLDCKSQQMRELKFQLHGYCTLHTILALLEKQSGRSRSQEEAWAV